MSDDIVTDAMLRVWGRPALAIVREFAERGPFIDTSEDYDACADCDVWKEPLTDPANHELPCLWKRVKAFYPGNADGG